MCNIIHNYFVPIGKQISTTNYWILDIDLQLILQIIEDYRKNNFRSVYRSFRACICMGLFKQNYETIQEENRELKKSLAELECEEAIIKDKEQFGRVRNSMMRVLRAKHSEEIANRILNRVNKRIQEGYLNQ